jgi:hypothetical protein
MQIIVDEEEIDPAVSNDDLHFFMKTILKEAALSYYIENRAGIRFLIQVWPGANLLKVALEQGKEPRELISEEAVKAAIASANLDQELGGLSRKYESKGDAAAIGFDNVGGFSYGLYQLASSKGSVASFLKFLEKGFPSYFAKLEAAGGDAGAREGTAQFKGAWRELAKEKDFGAAQHSFIKSFYYDVFAEKLARDLGLDLEGRSRALQDVAWSTAVQHGPNNGIFRSALSGISKDSIATVSDAIIINAVYDERSKMQLYFSGSSAPDQSSVLKRFRKERADALAMLNV